MPRRNLKKTLEKFHRIRTALNRQKVDYLDEEFRVTLARVANGLYKFSQSRQKSVVADSKQRPARNIAHTGSLDYQCGRLAFSETAIPVEILLRHETIFGRSPGHHRRDPRTVLESNSSDLYRSKQ